MRRTWPAVFLLALLVTPFTLAGENELKKASEAYKNQDYKAARDHAAAAVKADPKQQDAHLLLGLACLGLRDNAAAVEALTELIQLNPRLPFAFDRRGDAYLKLGEFKKAVEDFDRVLATNLRGTFLSCQEAMRIMVPQGGGTIINIASVVGFKGYANQSAYTASKHGIMGLTKALALEAQPHRIRVSAILPGGVDTGLATSARPDLKREELLRPEDIARTVLFLLSLPEHAAIDEIYIRRRNSAPF